MTYSYSELFYEYQKEGSARSARALLPTVVGLLGIRSVLDVGCGAGAWLRAYDRLGVSDYCGVDGEYVSRSALMFDPANFAPTDISQSFDLRRSFDLVQCLEVAEHLPPAQSGTLVDNIVRHGRMVLFSAAVPGQGGEHHTNERSYEYWRDLFVERRYRLFDFVRPKVQQLSEVEPWYRYNILFFAHDDVIALLPQGIVDTRVPDNAAIPDFSPPFFRLRKLMLRQLSPSLVTGISIVKHKLAVVLSVRR